MDKFIRNVNAQLWREAKNMAALEGLSIKDMIEEIIIQKLSLNPETDGSSEKHMDKYLQEHSNNTAKIIREVNPELWRAVKAQAALEGRSMKDWVERTIVYGLQRRRKKAAKKPVMVHSQVTEKTKILRNINEQLWREAKARAAREGKTMKEWVEQTVKNKLDSGEENNLNFVSKYREYNDTAKTKILRKIDDSLWRKAKAHSALEGETMKEWVESCIAEALAQRKE